MNLKIYTVIKDRILSLHYEPGQGLNLTEMSKELGVSHTPIREALLRLEWEKLVAIRPRLGIHVTKIDFKELKEIYRSRIIIEDELCRLAARNITDEQIQAMKDLLAACHNINGERTRQALVDLDGKFRAILFRAADCRTLQELSELLYNQTLRVWHLTFDDMDVLSEVKIEAREIEDTIAVLSKRDESVVKDLRRKVIMSWIDRLHKYYARL